MKRKIAVFAGGWGGEYLQEILAGITKSSKKNNTDIFAFVNFSVHTSEEEKYVNIPEINFMKLPDMKEFDGAVLLTNSFNAEEEIEYLVTEIKNANIPVISIEYELPGIPTIITDNYAGMYDLAMHIFTEHNAKDVMFIGGPANHPECIERLHALQDAAKKCGLTIPDENIIYSDWSKTYIGQILNDWNNSHYKFPDVIICANDIMAMETVNQLNILGLSVPEDVMVTGYDCILPAQRFDPSITSVNHEWNTMGRKAFETISALIDGKEIATRSMLPTRFVKRFSCGCHPSFTSYDPKKDLGRVLLSNELDAVQADSHFRHFYVEARNSNALESFSDRFSALFENMHLIEGNSFALYLDPEFFNIVEDNSNLKEYGHCDNYYTIVNLEGGKKQPLTTITKREALFGKAEATETAGCYLYLPIFSDTRTYGFAMLTGSLNAINDSQYYIWTRHMNQALTQVRSNLTIQKLYAQMRELSIKDFLTGTYNRTGCETIAYPEMINDGKNGFESTILLVDLDKMKKINDSFGHASGDMALVATTKVLQKALPEGFNITRFGGDEFLITGASSKLTSSVEELITHIEDTLQAEIEEHKYAFPLSLSIGYSTCTPTSVEEIEKGIVFADINMYTMKKLHHIVL